MTMRRVAVIGGGISGIATAGLLARNGYDVTLFEARDRLGGRAGLWEANGFRFDEGPSWYLMPEVFDHFYRLMGSSAEEQLDLVQLDPAYRVIFEPDPSGTVPASSGGAATIDIRATRRENLAVFEEVEPGAGRALDRYLTSAKSTYEMAKERFLYGTFADLRPLINGEVLQRTGELAGLLLTPLDRFVGRRFREPRLRQILGYPAVFLGSSPFDTPSMYHLMSYLDLEDGVLYPRGGLTRVIETMTALAVASGVKVVTGATVTQILTATPDATDSADKRAAGRRGKPEARGIRYRDPAGAEVEFAADLVIATADLHHVETELLPPQLSTYPAKWWERRTAGPSAVLIYLGVRGRLPELEHHTLLFARDWRANFQAIFGAKTSIPDPASIYVCRPSATDAEVAPDGTENLFVLVPVPADPTIGAGGPDGQGDERIERLADTAIQQIASWAGIPDLADRVILRRTVGPADFALELHSWKGSALGPAHTLRQSAFFRAGNKSRRVAGLYYAGGSTIPGIGLPMCLISAELVLKRLSGDTTPGPIADGSASPAGVQ